MINLVGGRVQNQGGVAVPNGSISFQLNMDASVVATPSGIVPAEQVVTFQFDDTGNLEAGATLWSNAELNPKNSSGLGTYYLVTIYDANGARINKSPMWWQFPNSTGATVDISFMTAISTIGGNVIFYPNLSGSAFNGVNPQVANYTAVPEDSGKLIVFASANPVTLHLPATVPADTWFILVQNIGPGVLTIDRNGSTIDTAAVNLQVSATQGTVVGSSGTSYFTERGILSGSSSVSGYLGWHNVMDYGAVGDGVTDDSNAVQAAINAATLNPTGGGRVYFPKPTVNYYLAKPLFIDCYNAAQVYLYGDGGPRQGGISQFARAPRIRVQGDGISLMQIDNYSGGGGNYQVGDTGTISADPTGSGATFQVTQVSGQRQVQLFNVTAGGSGYVPNVTGTTRTSGAGSGLLFNVSQVSGGVITTIAVAFKGTGYQVGDTGTINANPTGSGGTYQVTATSGGTVTGFTLTAGGTGYAANNFTTVQTVRSSGAGNNLFRITILATDTSGAITSARVAFPSPGSDLYITMENLDFEGLNGNAIYTNHLPFLYLKNCGVASNFDQPRDFSAPLIQEGSTLWTKCVDSNFFMNDHNSGEYRPTMNCTGVTTADGSGNAVYSITPQNSGFGVIFPNGGEGNRNYIGMAFNILGFVAHVGNNGGPYVCVAASGTSLTLHNPSAIAEVHAATCQSPNTADPSSWAPPSMLIVANDPEDGCVLFNFDYCTYGFGGVKLEVVAPAVSGDTFADFIFNQCALEGSFGGPLLQVENVSAVGGSSNVQRVIMADCQLADLAHEAPLLSVKGYPNTTMGIGSVTAVHCTSHGGIVQGLYDGFSSAAGIYVDDPITSTRILGVASTVMDGSSQVSHRHSGFDCFGPVEGPASAFRYDTSDGGALRTFIATAALADSATSMRDMDGSDYFGPGGVTGTPFDMKVGRSSNSQWAVQVPVPYPANFVAVAAAGGSLPDGTYYLRIASGRRYTSPFTASTLSPEIGPVVLGGGNNTIHCTWTAVPTNTLDTGHYTIFLGPTGAENHAAQTAAGNLSATDISALPGTNVSPNELTDEGTLLTAAFTLDGTGGRTGTDPTNPESTNAGGLVLTADDTHAPIAPAVVVAWLKIKSSGQTYYLPMSQ